MGVELMGKVAGPDRLRQYRLDRGRPRPGPEDAGDRLRPVPVARAGAGSRRREGRARRAAGAGRLHHAAHAAHRADPQHPRPREPDEDQAGRADGQLRPRRAGRRAGGGRPDRRRPHRRRRVRRVRGRAGQGIAAVRARRGGGDAASGRFDRRGAGERGPAGGRADQRLPDLGRDRERAEHALGDGRGGAAAEALHEARRAAGLVRRPAHRSRVCARSRSAMPAMRPRSTPGR